MSKKTQCLPHGGSEKLHVTVPTGLAERLRSVAKDKNCSLGVVITETLENNFDMARIMSQLKELNQNQDMLLFSMEILAARLDEITKLIINRVPSREKLSEEEKRELNLKAQNLSKAMARAAAEAAMAYRTGVTTIDPLSIEQVIDQLDGDLE